MSMNLSLAPDVVHLQNRLGRLTPVSLNCFVFRDRYCVILRASREFPARQLSNSAEHLAHQIVARLGVAPEQVDFFQWQPGDHPEWLRWAFQWVGRSPLKGRCEAVSAGLFGSYLRPLQQQGHRFSLLRADEPAVA